MLGRPVALNKSRYADWTNIYLGIRVNSSIVLLLSLLLYLLSLLYDDYQPPEPVVVLILAKNREINQIKIQQKNI